MTAVVQEKYAHTSRKQLICKKKPARTIGKGLDQMMIYNGMALLMS